MNALVAVGSLAGGALIGASASLLLYSHGRVAGISGIVGALVRREPQSAWRASFVGALMLTGVVGHFALPGAFDAPVALRAPYVVLLVAAGLLVGYGTQLGGGCTSGHGVCGISRGTTRSIVATVVFMLTAAITVFVMRHMVPS